MEDDSVMDFMFQHHGIISREQALSLGLSPRQIDYRLSSRRWIAAFPSVYRHAQLGLSWHGRMLAACLGHRALASHRAAAVLHGIEGFQPGRVEIVVAAGRWRPPVDVVVHQSAQIDLVDPVIKDSIPCAGLARTVLDVAAVVPRKRLEFTVDAVIRKGQLGLPDLCEILARHSRKGRDGCGRLREVLDDRLGLGGVPLSDWSRMVGDLLAEGGLPAPEYEHRVLQADGRLIAQVDLAYPHERIAIELDSVAWHLNRESFERDPRRRNRLIVSGWTVLTFTWSDYVDQPAALRATVRSTLHEIRSLQPQFM